MSGVFTDAATLTESEGSSLVTDSATALAFAMSIPFAIGGIGAVKNDRRSWKPSSSKLVTYHTLSISVNSTVMSMVLVAHLSIASQRALMSL